MGPFSCMGPRALALTAPPSHRPWIIGIKTIKLSIYYLDLCISFLINNNSSFTS